MTLHNNQDPPDSEATTSNPQCWANAIGGCQGKLTREHYISQCVLDNKIIRVQGFGFCKEDYKDISRKDAVSRILCERHNNQLSHLDNEALTLKNALFSISTVDDLVQKPSLWTGPEQKTVSGLRITRWLTKVYCNVYAMEGRCIDPDFVRYTFACPTSQPIFCHVLEPEGARFHFGDGDIQYAHFRDSEDRPGFFARYFGIDWVVCKNNCTMSDVIEFSEGQGRILTKYLKLRPATLSLAMPLGYGIQAPTVTIKLTWE